MHFARVVGTVVATEKVSSWRGSRMLLLQPCNAAGEVSKARALAAIDLVSAAQGQLVFYVRGREAAVALANPENPADAAIVGIVDAARETPAVER